MKIVCDCGQVMEFKMYNDVEDSDTEINAKQDWNKIEINAEHDECWIRCDHCNETVHFWA